MTIAFSLPPKGNFPSSTTVILISATSSDDKKTEYGNLPIYSSTYYEFLVPGNGPWEIEVSGWYPPQGPIKVNNQDDIISILNDVATVTTKA